MMDIFCLLSSPSMRRLFLHSLLLMLALPCHAAERPQVQFINDILQQSDAAYSTGMRNLVGEVVKEAGVDPAKAAELQEVADAAVKTKMDKSKEDLWAVWDKLAVNDEVNQVAFWQAYRKLPNAQLTPERFPVWDEGLRRVLTPEQFGKWEKLAATKRARIDKAVATCLQKGREAWVVKRMEIRNALAESLITVHQLPEAQAKALRTGVSTLVTESSGKWGQQLEAQIRDYVKTAFIGQAEDRLQALENGGLNFNSEGDEEALKQEDNGWMELVKSVLTADQLAQYQAGEAKKAERRLSSIAQVVVAEVDRKVLLTADQRAKLEPIVRKVIVASQAKLESLLSQTYVNSEMLLGVFGSIKEDEVKQILEPEQWDGWKESAARMSYFMEQ